jgi:hypothetical protein
MTKRGRLLGLLAAVMTFPVAVAGAPVAPAQPAETTEVQQVSIKSAALPVAGSERGLQIQTIMARRAIVSRFPEIREIGGVRPDSMKWHPEGLAIDVMIPNWQTPAGRALGDRIAKFVSDNGRRFGLDNLIWQRMYIPAEGKPYLMNDAGNPDANHFTHVHIATYGGGYPTGRENFLD